MQVPLGCTEGAYRSAYASGWSRLSAGLALAMVVDEHIALAAFLADSDTHRVLLLHVARWAVPWGWALAPPCYDYGNAVHSIHPDDY